MGWIDLAQDIDQWRTLVKTVMNFRVAKNIGKYLSTIATGHLSRIGQLLGVS
jgi:hypothetical protein